MPRPTSALVATALALSMVSPALALVPRHEEELAVGELGLGGTPVADGIPGENIERKGRHPSAHMDRSTSIVTGVAEAPGA